jgi:hypothetical protein
MTPQERKSLAEQITANPLFTAILDEMETGAVEALIYAQTEEHRLTRQLKVQAIREFRADLGACLDTREPKSAPA